MNLLDIKPKPYIFLLAALLSIFMVKTASTQSRPAIRVLLSHESSIKQLDMPAYIKAHAKADYHWLSTQLNQTFFNTRSLRNSKLMRTMMTTGSRGLPERLTCGQHGTTKVNEKLKVHWTYFDRGSDSLLLVGGGLATNRELLAPFVALFPKYDIVIFDYRGHGLDHKPKTRKGRLSKRFANLDCTVVTLGEHEEEEVVAILNDFKTKKKYEHVFGLGLCYSAVIFAKTEAMYPGSFEKLIFDGSWPDMKQLVDRFSQDPKLFLDPQRGSTVGRLFGKIPPFRWLFRKFFEWMFNTNTSQGINALESFSKLSNVPVLLFHSTNDLLISNEQFEEVWNAIPHNQKMAVITPGRHLQNFIKHKELFALMGQLFFENSYQKSCRTILNQERFEKEKKICFILCNAESPQPKR